MFKHLGNYTLGARGGLKKKAAASPRRKKAGLDKDDLEPALYYRRENKISLLMIRNFRIKRGKKKKQNRGEKEMFLLTSAFKGNKGAN